MAEKREKSHKKGGKFPAAGFHIREWVFGNAVCTLNILMHTVFYAPSASPKVGHWEETLA
jgi:hypothetical protein